MSLIIFVIGFGVYFDGLKNPFLGDDSAQIVNNIPVHSITNIRIFFEGSTFYNGQGLAPLIGVYYRPLMTTIFSLVYTFFGPHAFYYHLLQLLIYIASAIFLYLFFCYSFKPTLALFLSLIFLVHPINSQIVFSIAAMQDALFFFFGIIALWLLVRYSSLKSLWLVALCLFLSLLSKESGILFVVMAVLYLFWWSRRRLVPFIGIIVLPTVTWLVLRFNAIGLNPNPRNVPIDSLGLLGRLMTAPSILLFYITKFLFPLHLVSGYYWVYKSFSFRHFLIPLIIDTIVIAAVIYGAVYLRRKSTEAIYYTYLFFAAWTALGMLILMQITPLDMTACETWFYFPLAGLLGMLGIIGKSIVLPKEALQRWLIVLMVVLLGLLGIRTTLRGHDWSTQYVLAKSDVAVSSSDFTADYQLAIYYFNHGDYNKAKPYAIRSVAIYPDAINEYVLGSDLTALGDYQGGYSSLVNGLNYQRYYALYNTLAMMTLYYGNSSTNQTLLTEMTTSLPTDSMLWEYLAIFDDAHNNNPAAKVAILKAQQSGLVPKVLFDEITYGQSFTVNLSYGKSIRIP